LRRGVAEGWPDHPIARGMEKLLAAIIILGVVIIPLWVSPTGRESFRVPKLLLFRLEGILLVTAYVLICCSKTKPKRLLDGTLSQIAVLSVFGWALITGFFAGSTKWVSTLSALMTVSTCVAVFLASRAVATNSKRDWLVYLPLVPAVVNAALLLLQRTGVWNPWISPNIKLSVADHDFLSRSALLGNPGDVAGYLVVPFLIALYAIFSKSLRLRIMGLCSTGLISAALALSATMASVLALAGAIVATAFTLTLVRWRRGRPLIAALLVVLAAGAMWTTFELGKQVRKNPRFLDTLLSGRIVSFVAAAKMGRDHPLTGVGPGGFSVHYFQYQIATKDRFADYIDENSSRLNYSEVHNDFLQIFAESGVPGLIMFVAIIGYLLRCGFREIQARPSVASALLFAMTIAVSLLSFAHFAFQLAASLVTYAFSFGVLMAGVERSDRAAL